MRGHIAKKGKRYYVVVDAPSEDGKRRQQWHPGGGTKAEAEAELTRILSRLQGGEYVSPSRVTVRAFLEDEWLPAVRSTIRPGTLAVDEVIISAHILPHIGRVRLQALSPGHLNRLYAVLLEHGGRGRRPLAPKTVRNAHTVLHRALAAAVRWGRVARNVAALADPPKRGAREMQTWTAEELRAFLTHIQGDRLYPAWLTLATTGMRRGEVLAPRWADLDGGRLAVRRSLVLVGGTPAFSEPKTAKGRRSVPLPPETVAALQAYRKRQLEERLALGPAYQDSDLIFCREDGEAIHPHTFSEAFERHVRDANLPRLSLHGLRHTWATLALRAGEHPKVVSEILGHANISITLDTYSHAIPAMQEEAAARVAGLIFGDSNG